MTDKSTQALALFLDRCIISGPVEPMFALPDDVKEELKDSDFHTTTFPKCGTNFVQQAVHLLQLKGDDSQPLAIPWLMKHDMFGGTKASLERASQRTPRVFHNHAEAHDALKLRGKHILVLRKPEDAMVSAYNFLPNNCNVSTDDLSMEDFYFGFFANHINTCMNYWTHLVSWYRHRNDERVLWLHFEQMKSDMPKMVNRIAKFMNIDLDEQLKATVVEKSSFAYMSKNKAKLDVKVERLRRNFLVPDDEQQIPFTGRIRKGGSNYEIPAKIQMHMDLMWEKFVKPETGCANYEELMQKIIVD